MNNHWGVKGQDGEMKWRKI